MTAENTPTEERFSQVWNRDEKRREDIAKVANRLAENVGDVSSTSVKKKTWGVLDWIKNLIIFFLVQSVVSVALLGAIDNDAFTNPTALTESATNPVFLATNMVLMYVIWLGGMTWVTYTRGERSFKKDFKLAFKKWDAFIGLGIAALLYGIMIGVQLLLTEVLGLDLAGADNGATFLSFEGVWFIIIAIGFASLIGPFCEELWFRGFLMNSILKTIQNRRKNLEDLNISEKSAPTSWKLIKFFEKIRYPLAAIVSSAIFGMFHFQGLESFGHWFILFATGTLGLVFAISALFFKRLGPGIFGHIFYNFSTLMIALLFAS